LAFGLWVGVFFLAMAGFFWLRFGGVLSESSLDVGGGRGFSVKLTFGQFLFPKLL